MTAITEEEFGTLLGTFRESAWRLETRDSYALDYEAQEFADFLDGHPAPPPEVGWWAPWLDRITEMTRAEGKTIGRVRVVSEPPSDYQLWEMWAGPWHAEAGEDIGYLTRSQAARIGLPVAGDWWLLDDERLILMRFDRKGRIAGKTLTSDPELIAEHCAWRDLAVRYATPAAEFITAA